MRIYNSKIRLFEVMKKVDRSFKPALNENINNPHGNIGDETKLNETFGDDEWVVKENFKYQKMIEELKERFNQLFNNGDYEIIDTLYKLLIKSKSNITEVNQNIDLTKNEIVNFLRKKFNGLGTENLEFDIETAIYWFANQYHGGQNSNLYSVLSTSQFKPSPLHNGIEDEESEVATEMYNALVSNYGGSNEEIVNENIGNNLTKYQLSDEINALKKKYMGTISAFDFFTAVISGLGTGAGIDSDDYSKEVRQHFKNNTPID